MRLQLGRARPGQGRLSPVAFGFFASAAVFTGMGFGSWLGVTVVPGRAAPDPRLLPLASPDVASLVPGRALPSVTVAPDQAGALLGVDLGWSRAVTAPGADSKTTVEECRLADPVGMRAAYGQDWAAFSKTTVQPAEDDDSTQVVLAVGLYPSEAKARGAFAAVVSALRVCDGKSTTETTAQGAEFALTFHADPTAADALRWRSEREDAGGRRCAYDARARRNAFLEVMVCVAGEDAREAKGVADALEGSLPP
ncbi:sensor domain-containing protein [Segniliparus rugosus]|uniref:PknH-like extracellular domain-containing protein n=1 Tax=Segniliparus rugosus (strain ATCC BAA-974 / DSM 45345 / CCUG 50838 / CIP 108380 / JCM 13579 / CDC 945) TaxID=679197 RepID=E5XSA7_SEGRC|nr:sensor domain-containing protein [Segniliparus rugosus]EFV12765.1 hypothetical protein HMPREF9336_02379 [Segniliparus rugosus ATCC BAA-974]